MLAPEAADSEKKFAVGSRTIRAMDEKASNRTALRNMSLEAAKYASEKGIGVRKALKTGLFKPATRNSTQPLLREMKKRGKAIDERLRDHAKQILLNKERMQLGQWVMKSADG